MHRFYAVRVVSRERMPCIVVINITNFTKTPTTNDHDGQPPSSKPHTEPNKDQQTNKTVSNIR
jgi:hypothetical protein